MRSLSGARSVELIGKHNDDDDSRTFEDRSEGQDFELRRDFLEDVSERDFDVGDKGL